MNKGEDWLKPEYSLEPKVIFAKTRAKVSRWSFILIKINMDLLANNLYPEKFSFCLTPSLQPAVKALLPRRVFLALSSRGTNRDPCASLQGHSLICGQADAPFIFLLHKCIHGFLALSCHLILTSKSSNDLCDDVLEVLHRTSKGQALILH